MLWLAWDPAQSVAPPPLSIAVPVFLGGYFLLVLGTAIWGRHVSRKVAARNFQTSLRRFNLTMEAARIAIPIWFGIGLCFLGWRDAVAEVLRPSLMISVLGVIVGTLPPLAAWMGLWWSQFPADRALREQSILALIDNDLPLHAPPRFASYFLSNLRLQVLFLGIPVLLIVLGHDAGILLGSFLHLQERPAEILELASWIVSIAAIFIFAPEILRRVLHTESLGDSALRQRLDALCRRTGIRYRDILLWKTDHNMGNAAVMGFVPRLRYILLSDLLIESMPDDEIEAVFAHELGHIVHRHLNWYVVFVVVLGLINAGPGTRLGEAIASRLGGHAQDLLPASLMMGTFLLLFGYVSRKFERQADVYAARTMQMRHVQQSPDGASIERIVDSSSGPILPSAGTPGEGQGGGLLRQGRSNSMRAIGAIEPPPQPSPRVPGEAENVAVAQRAASDARPLSQPFVSFVGPYGASLFASALRRVAVVNNIPVGARSWCHGSIATRMEYLQGLSADPQRTTRFDHFMRRLYASIIAALVVSATVFAMTSYS